MHEAANCAMGSLAVWTLSVLDDIQVFYQDGHPVPECCCPRGQDLICQLWEDGTHSDSDDSTHSDNDDGTHSDNLDTLPHPASNSDNLETHSHPAVCALVLAYPLAPRHTFPAAVHGVMAALDWIDRHPGVRVMGVRGWVSG